jgi:hypothetical protein
MWNWSTLAAVASAAIALCALSLSVSGSRRQRRRDQADAKRESSMQPSLVYCWLELKPSTISKDYASEVLVAWNRSNQVITNVEGDPGVGRPRVKWREILPGGKVRSAVGGRSVSADDIEQFAAADQLYVTEFNTVNNIARAVAANHSCEIEFDTVTATRWKRKLIPRQGRRRGQTP